MSGPALEIRDLGVTINCTAILTEVSFDVAVGEFVTIIGPNGAGKTTLIKCLDRIIGLQAGAIRLTGQPLASYRRRDLARAVAYVPQAGAESIPFTVQEFVMMGRYPHLSPFSRIGAQDEKVVQAALQLTGTEQFGPRRMNTLSGGERQKVFIAAALTQEASILLLDEPTTFLDPRHQADIHLRLRRINREWGVTIVAVTHDINAAARLSDRIVALKKGRVVFCGTPAELMGGETLQTIYEARFLFVPHPQGGAPVVVEEDQILTKATA
jgi:iron complex transport system ATP-binding protein